MILHASVSQAHAARVAPACRAVFVTDGLPLVMWGHQHNETMPACHAPYVVSCMAWLLSLASFEPSQAETACKLSDAMRMTSWCRRSMRLARGMATWHGTTTPLPPAMALSTPCAGASRQNGAGVLQRVQGDSLNAWQA